MDKEYDTHVCIAVKNDPYLADQILAIAQWLSSDRRKNQQEGNLQ